MPNHLLSTRRRLLQAPAVIAGVAAPFAFARSASAWDVAPMDPASPAGLAYSGRCGGGREHAALIQKLRMDLADDSSLASISATCPTCGCPIVVGR